ncbi:MAG: hypothetical protein JXJ19_01685 [Elusimicrobia bacterium]|nr:hypothetical protein [Elusimicrobiota bacterium]
MRYLKMLPARCAADIGDGSERAEYVPQEHLLEALGRPSRAVSIMFEYHPNEKNWPYSRIWDTRYYTKGKYTNGYFPYMAVHEKNTHCEPFDSIRDIRKFGQDVQLTMTFDVDTPDEHLQQIARDLRPFGRIYLRINHECNGHWFTFNKNYSYKEIGDFFVKFHGIIKEHAPNVLTNACFNGVNPDQDDIRPHMGEDELAGAFRAADIVSFDYYHSLHWGWPHDGYDPVKDGVKARIRKVEKAYNVSNRAWWGMLHDFHDLMLRVNNGREKDIYICEANTDADVVGLKKQAGWIRKFYAEVRRNRLEWLKGVTYYQFRDRGGLGLEYEPEEDKKTGRENPSLGAYREAVKDDYFCPVYEEGEETVGGAQLEWISAENATGIYIERDIPRKMKKFEIRLPEQLNLIIEINKKWFRKPPGSGQLDATGAVKPGKKARINIFAPPPTGENAYDKDNKDYLDVYRCSMAEEPEVLIS